MSQLQTPTSLVDPRVIGPATLHTGDVLDILPLLPDSAFDSIVTDTPYELTTGRGASIDLHMGPKALAARNVAVWEHCLRVLKPGGHLLAFSGSRTYHRMAYAIEAAGFEIRDQVMWVYGSGFPKSLDVDRAVAKQAPHMKGQWEGWGTALKPSCEPICLARRPFSGTVADNLIAYNTGAINIDACRVGEVNGRWPTNLVHDGSDEVRDAFPDAPGQLARASAPGGQRAGQNVYGALGRGSNGAAPRVDDDRSAARFFYCAKASPTDRGSYNNHPSVKPTSLLRWLVRLITPPGGHVLDPFMGSGSTGKACALEGAFFTGIEIRSDYVDIADRRLREIAA